MKADTVFVNSAHLPQKLAPEHYHSEEIYQRELTKLFLPGWHCIAMVAEIPRVGDFQTIEILGRPLIVWHTAEGFKTYLNVCAHRFCVLTDEASGHAVKSLTCQYHGWEYDTEGNTCRIPDAQSFRPLEKGQLGLREFRTQAAGQLIFVSFAEQPTPLSEWLGTEIFALCEEWFGPDARTLPRVDLEFECNWKIVIENVLESYHVESVHPKTFVRYPNSEHCHHAFHENHDHYIHDYTHEAAQLHTFPERFIAWLSGTRSELRWHHLLRYPNLVLGGSESVKYVQMIWPLSPKRCRSYSIFMDRPGRRGRFRSGLAHFLLNRYGGRFIRRVQLEDARLYPKIQRGTVCADRPHGGGLISIREERIFAFQDRVLKSLT